MGNGLSSVNFKAKLRVMHDDDDNVMHGDDDVVIAADGRRVANQLESAIAALKVVHFFGGKCCAVIGCHILDFGFWILVHILKVHPRPKAMRMRRQQCAIHHYNKWLTMISRKQSRLAQRLARWAHNPEVGGSNPLSAMTLGQFFATRSNNPIIYSSSL